MGLQDLATWGTLLAASLFAVAALAGLWGAWRTRFRQSGGFWLELSWTLLPALLLAGLLALLAPWGATGADAPPAPASTVEPRP